jgi:hypothetical protein
MQPPSFDDFIRRECTRTVAEKDAPAEQLTLSCCPAPGCGCHALLPLYDHDMVTGFTCGNGCVFSARRNVFTGEIMYYKLERMPSQSNGSDVCGLKFTTLGEPYNDWY